MPWLAYIDDLFMTTFVSILMTAAVCTAVAIYQLQVRLEEWDHERHVDD